MPSEWVWAAQISTPAWTWIFVSAGISGGKNKSHQGYYQSSLLFVFILFGSTSFLPGGFDSTSFVWVWLGLLLLLVLFCFVSYCSPSSHFVFSILSLEAMSRPAVGTPLSPIGLTVALSLQLTLRPLNISMFQVGAGTVCVSLSCHSVECSLCNLCLVSIVSHRLPWVAPSGFGTASGLAERSSALRDVVVYCGFYLFSGSGVWLLGCLWAMSSYELCRAWFFSQLHKLSTSIALLILEELVLIHMQERGGQVSHYICCSFRLLWLVSVLSPVILV